MAVHMHAPLDDSTYFTLAYIVWSMQDDGARGIAEAEGMWAVVYYSGDVL